MLHTAAETESTLNVVQSVGGGGGGGVCVYGAHNGREESVFMGRSLIYLTRQGNCNCHIYVKTHDCGRRTQTNYMYK